MIYVGGFFGTIILAIVVYMLYKYCKSHKVEIMAKVVKMKNKMNKKSDLELGLLE